MPHHVRIELVEPGQQARLERRHVAGVRPPGRTHRYLDQDNAFDFACWNSDSLRTPWSRSAASRAISSALPPPPDAVTSCTYWRIAASCAWAASIVCCCIFLPRAIRYTNTPRYGMTMTKIVHRALPHPERSELRKMSPKMTISIQIQM